jgi:hypothetical protein
LAPQTILLYPGEVQELQVNLLDLLPDVATLTADQLYGVTIEVDARYGDPFTPNSLKSLFDKKIYVYRYLNASDPGGVDPAVKDKSVLLFPGTLNDDSGGVTRPRPVEFHVGVTAQPNFQFADPTNFYFDDAKSSFVFDPVSNAKDVKLTTTVKLVTPDNNPVGSPLTLEGEGTPKFNIYVNSLGLASTLRALAEDLSNPWFEGKLSDVDYYLLTDSKRAMIDTDIERDAIVNQVIADIEKNYADYSDGISITDDPNAPNAIKIVWTTTVDPLDKGYSKFDKVGDGLDNKDAIIKLLSDPTQYNAPVQDFILSEALNKSFSTPISVFVNSHLEDNITMPYLLTPAQLASALAKSASHEAGHTLGLLHTAQAGKKANVKQEIQKVVLSNGGPGSKFTLSFDGKVTPELDPGISDADLASELGKFSNIGSQNIQVAAGPPGTFIVTFVNRLEGVNVPELSGAGSNGLVVQVNTTQQGHTDILIQQDANNVKAEVNVGASLGVNDIMAGGYPDPDGAKSFLPGLSAEALKIGLKIDWTPQDAQKALSFEKTQFAIHVGEIPFDGSEDDFDPPSLITGRHLAVFDGDNQLASSSLDLGTVRVDGTGGEHQTRVLSLVNYGNEDVTIQSAEILDPDGNFTANTLSGLVVKPGESVPFVIDFDPVASGDLKATLHIECDDPALLRDFDLHGFGLSPNGDIRLTVPNNNVGGLKLSDPLRYEHGFATIRNIGEQPLSITNVVIAGGSDQFELFNLPPGMSVDHPYLLGPGQSFDIDMTFDAKYLGLQRAEIQIFSNDPDTPVLHQGVVGTGLADIGSALAYGNDFVGLETPLIPAAPALHQVSDDKGGWSFFVPSNTSIHYVIFDPVSGLVAESYGTSASSGQQTELLEPFFVASTAPDTDGDGLPDDIEFAIGTSPHKVDTDGDGLSDFVQVEEGLDPLGGKAFPTGVIANVAIQGEAQKVTFATANADVQKVIGYVAAGSGGLAVLDVSNFAKPKVMTQLQLPGVAVDIDVDPSTQIAAVAASSGGLHLVDVSDPQNPQLKHTIPVLTSLVRTYAGVAYIVSGTGLQAYDLQSGAKVGALDLNGDVIRTMARENNLLYVVDSLSVLHIVEIKGMQMVARGSLHLPSTCTDLVVGNGIAYAMASSNAQGSYETLDVSNPDQPVLISDSDVVPPIAYPRTALALNGSGKAVLVGRINGAGTAPPVLAVVDSSNPQVTNGLLTQLNLAGEPLHVALASGIAYVAEGLAGIEVANFLPFDSLGIAPLVSVVPGIADADPNTPGTQVLEGSYFPVQAQVQDDVQVRDVQLLIDGEVVASAVSFPFNLAAIAPRIQGQKNTFTLQVRATDTGGNTTLTAPLTIDLLPDVTPPSIVKTDPADGEKKPRGFRSVQITFSEAIASADVNNVNFQVFDENNNPIPAESVALRGEDKIVQVNFADLNSGNYRLVVHRAGVHDRAGNVLDDGDGDFVTHFSIDLYSLRFEFNKNSDFLDPANWDLGRVPGPQDYVLIDVPQNIVVQLTQFGAYQHPNVAVTVAGMTVNTPLLLEVGGDLTVLEKLELNSTLSMNDGILHQANIVAGPGAKLETLPLTGSSPFVDDFGNVGTLDGVTLTGSFGSDLAYFTLINGLTVNGVLTNIGFSINRQDTFIKGEATIREGRFDVLKGRSLVLRDGVNVLGQTLIQVADGTTFTNKGHISSNRAAAYTNIIFLKNNDGATTVGRLINDGTLEAVNGGILAIQDSVGVGPGQIRLCLQNNNVMHVGEGSILWLDHLDLTSAKMIADGGSTVLFASRLRPIARKPSILSGSGLWLVNGQPDGTDDFTRVGVRSTLFAGGTVNLVDGAVLRGSIFLSGVTVNGDIELTQDYPVPQKFQGVFRPNAHDVVISGIVEINGTVKLGGVRDTFEAHLLGAGHGAVLTGRASVLFSETPGNAVETSQSFSEFTVGALVTVEGSNLHIGSRTGFNSSLTNHGTFNLADGTVLIDGTWSNPDGHINVTNTAVTLAGIFAPGDIAGFVRSGGSVDLTGAIYGNGATLQLDAATGSWTFDGGYLIDCTLVALDGTSLLGTAKAGTLNNVVVDGLVSLPAGLGVAIHANSLVVDQGTLEIGAGTSVDSIDSFEQRSSGRLELTIGGTPDSSLFGKLTVADKATLDGILNLSLAPGFDPNLGDVYTIVSASTISGAFASINGLQLGNGNQFQVAYSGGKLTLTVVAA